MIRLARTHGAIDITSAVHFPRARRKRGYVAFRVAGGGSLLRSEKGAGIIGGNTASAKSYDVFPGDGPGSRYARQKPEVRCPPGTSLSNHNKPNFVLILAPIVPLAKDNETA